MVTRLILLITLLFSKNSFSQELQSSLINLTQEQGLPSNETYCVIKDSKNYIWVSSDQGVARLNGTTVKLIEGLPDHVVFKIREDKKGRVWFFSQTHKLSYYLNEKLYVFKFNDEIQKNLKSTILLDAYINDYDEIIMNTSFLKSFKINIQTGNFSELKYKKTNDSEDWEVHIRWLSETFCFAQAVSYSRMTFNTIGLKNHTLADTLFYKIPLKEEHKFRFYGCVPGANKEIYFFASNVLIKLFPDGTFKKITLEKEVLSVKYNNRRKRLYVGLREGGVVQFHSDDFKRTVQSDILIDKSISGIAFDNEGGEWFTTLESGVYFNKAQYISKLVTQKVLRLGIYNDSIIVYANRFGLHQLKNGISSTLVKERIKTAFDIKSDRDGDIIVTGEFNALRFNNNYKTIYTGNIGGKKRKIYFVTASSILSKETDTSYVFRNSNSLFRYLKKPGVEYEVNTVRDNNLPEIGYVYTDTYRKMWYVGNSNLYVYDPGSQKFILYENEGIQQKSVASIQQMPDNHYVFGMRTGGLVVLEKTVVIGLISQVNGFVNSPVRHLVAVGNDLWVTTTSGVSVIRFKSYQPLIYSIKSFGENSGLNNQVIYQIAAYQGSMLVSTSRGVYQINDLRQKIAETAQPIPFYFTSFESYKGETTHVKKLILPYNHNRLVVNFNAISFNSPGSLKYFYRFSNSNSDSTWFTIKANQLVIDELGPGSHTLEMKAGIPTQGRFSPIRTLSIIIEKPWWEKNLVIGTAVSLFLALLYYFFSRRISYIRKKEEEKTLIREKLLNLEQTALRSQMNPHFIFNCLSSIQQLVLSGNKDEANDYLVKFARLIRSTLELSALSYISLAKEKDYLTEYAEMEQLRLTHPFKFEFRIDSDIDINRTQIPNMMLQPIVENSIRHGIKGLKDRRGIISIYIKKEQDGLTCEITDNGVGRKKNAVEHSYANHKSYGLDIVYRRLKGLAVEEEYYIKVIDMENNSGKSEGTKVILQLPLKIASV